MCVHTLKFARETEPILLVWCVHTLSHMHVRTHTHLHTCIYTDMTYVCIQKNKGITSITTIVLGSLLSEITHDNESNLY